MQSGASGAAILVVLCACGRIGFAPQTSDAASDELDGHPVEIDAAVCAGPFTEPAVVAATQSAANEWGAALSPDGLELYFGSDRTGGAGGYDIYRVTRASRAAAFEMATLVTEIATDQDEDNPFVTVDGLELWFDRGGEIMRAIRVDRSSPWQPPQPVAALNTGDSDVAAMVRDDMLAVYFASNRAPTVGNFDIYIATRATPADAFGAPVPLSALNTASFDCCPHVAERGAQLMFTTGALDPGNAIAVVALDSAGLPTGSVTLAPFDDTGEEVDAYETPDGTLRGYAYRPTLGTGDFDLYLMERSCP